MARATEPVFIDRIHNSANKVCDRYMADPKYRQDGWPLCPNCGQDELYSLEIPPTIETIRGCYLCGPISPAALTKPTVPQVITPAIYRKIREEEKSLRQPIDWKSLGQIALAFFGSWGLLAGLAYLVVTLSRGWRPW